MLYILQALILVDSQRIVLVFCRCLVYSGAYATVKKCVQKETGHVYAVKTIKAANHNIRKDVKREIELMRKLDGHNKLVQLHEAYQTPFQIAMVLE